MPSPFRHGIIHANPFIDSSGCELPTLPEQAWWNRLAKECGGNLFQPEVVLAERRLDQGWSLRPIADEIVAARK
jgi:hypothetical protein